MKTKLILAIVCLSVLFLVGCASSEETTTEESDFDVALAQLEAEQPSTTLTVGSEDSKSAHSGPYTDPAYVPAFSNDKSAKRLGNILEYACESKENAFPCTQINKVCDRNGCARTMISCSLFEDEDCVDVKVSVYPSCNFDAHCATLGEPVCEDGCAYIDDWYVFCHDGANDCEPFKLFDAQSVVAGHPGELITN